MIGIVVLTVTALVLSIILVLVDFLINKEDPKVKEIEELLGKKVYLDLFVKTIPKWRDKEKYLQEFGYNDFLE